MSVHEIGELGDTAADVHILQEVAVLASWCPLGGILSVCQTPDLLGGLEKDG